MHDEVTRLAPETVSAGPVKIAPKRVSPAASAPPAAPSGDVATMTVPGVRLAPASRIQRRSTGLIQRVIGGDTDVDEEEDEAVLHTTADVIGDENGPEAMKAKFVTAEKAARTSTDKIGTLALTNSTQINIAKKAVTAADELVKAAEAIADAVEEKRDAVETLQDDADISDEDLALLQDASTDYTKIFPFVKSTFHKLNEYYLEESGKVGLAADSAGASEAQTQKMNKLRGYWGSAALAKGHFDKHKGDTGAATEEIYLTRAHAHNNLVAGGTVLQKVKGKDTLTFDTVTGCFGVKSNEGAKQIRTFFRPNNGKKYYEKQ